MIRHITKTTEYSYKKNVLYIESNLHFKKKTIQIIVWEK